MPTHTIRFTSQQGRDVSGDPTENRGGAGMILGGVSDHSYCAPMPLYDCLDSSGNILFTFCGFGDSFVGKTGAANGKLGFDVEKATEHDAVSNLVWPASLTEVRYIRASDSVELMNFTSSSAIVEYTGATAYSPNIGLNRILFMASVAKTAGLTHGTVFDVEIEHTGACILPRSPYEDCVWVPNQAYTNDQLVIAAKEGEQHKLHLITTDASTVSASDNFDSFLANNSAVVVSETLPTYADKYLDTTAASNGSGDTKYDPYNVLPALDDGTVVMVIEGSTVGSTTFDFDTPLTVQNGVVTSSGGGAPTIIQNDGIIIQ